MKKNALEKQKDRNAFFDLAKALLVATIIGVALGALYVSPYPIYSKIIFFSVILLLGLILNEISRNTNIHSKSLDSLMLIYLQLNIMGKKQGIKQDQAEKTFEALQNEAAAFMRFDRMLRGDSEILSIIIYLILIAIIAFVTTIFI